MAIEICPLAADFGNWADWAGVATSAFALIVGTVVGVATAAGTIGVALLAHKTSERATQISHDAKAIAEKQHSDSVAAKLGAGRILGSLLAIEIRVLPMKIADALHRYEAAVDFNGLVVADISKFEQVVSELARGFMPAAQGLQEQLHNLPVQLGGDVATLIGMTRELGSTSVLVSSRILRKQDEYGDIVFAGYMTSKLDLISLKEQIQAMLAFSVRTATDFNAFAGGEASDYGPERAFLE
ncbi:hypothetical protein [Stenotrophomonas sp. PS02289]|uniref:hypothetical protein n=1 Tax=Stenotrophomonas sp. PS02289 TaxID=2991422 RepID=UPI00249CC0B1|nr:hypothetical protein [Stenotrophomonas sp. PS02289]